MGLSEWSPQGGISAFVIRHGRGGAVSLPLDALAQKELTGGRRETGAGCKPGRKLLPHVITSLIAHPSG